MTTFHEVRKHGWSAAAAAGDTTREEVRITGMMANSQRVAWSRACTRALFARRCGVNRAELADCDTAPEGSEATSTAETFNESALVVFASA